MDSILANTNKSFFICEFENPLISHKRLVVAVKLERHFPTLSKIVIYL